MLKYTSGVICESIEVARGLGRSVERLPESGYPVSRLSHIRDQLGEEERAGVQDVEEVARIAKLWQEHLPSSGLCEASSRWKTSDAGRRDVGLSIGRA